MWTTYTSGEWCIEIYGENMYMALLTNIADGEMFTCGREGIRYHKYLAMDGFEIRSHPFADIVVFRDGDFIELEKIDDYESAINTAIYSGIHNDAVGEKKENESTEIHEAIELIVGGKELEKTSHGSLEITKYTSGIFSVIYDNLQFLYTKRYGGGYDYDDINWKDVEYRLSIHGDLLICSGEQKLYCWSTNENVLYSMYNCYHKEMWRTHHPEYRDVEILENIRNSLTVAVLE